MLHDQIMHALYSCKSFHVPSFEFRVSSHASGAIFPCFGAVWHHISVLEFVSLHAILHPLPCLVRVTCYALGSVLDLHACVHAFRESHFHLMATDVSVAEVHSCWCKSIVH